MWMVSIKLYETRMCAGYDRGTRILCVMRANETRHEAKEEDRKRLIRLHRAGVDRQTNETTRAPHELT